MQPSKTVHLKPQTIEAFGTYILAAEAEAEQSLRGGSPFLWSDASPERMRRLREGQVVAQFWTSEGPIKVASGLIHDWIGAALLPSKTIAQVLALVQDYDNHKNIYQPEVIASKLISRHGSDFLVYLRLLKKKIITVVLDTEHEVHYHSVDETRWTCRSRTTRIAEVENVETPPAGYRQWIPVAIALLLAIRGTRRGSICRVSTYIFDQRRAVWVGMGDRADHPKIAPGIADQNSGSYTLCIAEPDNMTVVGWR